MLLFFWNEKISLFILINNNRGNFEWLFFSLIERKKGGIEGGNQCPGDGFFK